MEPFLLEFTGLQTTKHLEVGCSPLVFTVVIGKVDLGLIIANFVVVQTLTTKAIRSLRKLVDNFEVFMYFY